MIKSLFKTATICIALFSGLLIVAYGLLVLLSIQKSPLRPEVEAFLRPEQITVAPERNGFFYWIGLDAPEWEKPINHGQRVIATLGRQSSVAADPGAARVEQRIQLVHDRKILCHPENRMPCLALASQNAEQVRALANDNAELMRRYAALLEFDQFETDIPILNPMDAIPTSIQGFNLFTLARTLDAVDVSEGKTSDALKRLVNRVRFLRLMHTGSAELISRVIAQALLVRELQFLVEVAVAKPASTRAAATDVTAVVAPMTAAERSPLKWIRKEFSSKFSWINSGNPPAWQHSVCEAFLGGKRMEDILMNGNLEERCGRWDIRTLAFAVAPLTDRNALVNQWSETIEQLREIDGFDAFSYSGHLPKVFSAAESRDTKWHLRNPASGWIAKDFVAGSKSYLIQAIDLDRLFALTRLAVRVAEDHIKVEEIAAYVKRSDILDPATKEPFAWDAARSQVFFVPLDSWIAARGRVGGIDGRVGLSLK